MYANLAARETTALFDISQNSDHPALVGSNKKRKRRLESP
jgi:hypothetical protein